jgi:hypothetical protein
VLYDTIYCIEYSYLVLDTIYFARSKFSPSEDVTQITLRGLKEYPRAEGVSAKLGVALELVVDLSHSNEVPETAEYCEIVPHSSTRSHVDVVLGGNGTGMR